MPTITPKRPIRVPRGNSGPIPPPGPPIEQDGPLPGQESPFPLAPDEDEDDEDTPRGINVGATIHEAAQARMKARKLPPLPPKVTFEEWCSYWKQLTEEQKSHIALYWYRLKPVIDRQIVDPSRTKNIDCAGSDEQMSYEYMLNTHGGGVYQGLINDTDIRKNGQFSSIIFEIPLSQHDPILNLEELDMVSRENQVYINKLKAKGILTSDGRINKNPTAEARKDDIMSSSVVNRLLDAALDTKRNIPIPQGDNGISNLVLEMMKQNNPNNQLATLLAVVEKLKPQAPAEKPDTALEWLKMMETQRATYEARLAEMNTKLFELATKPVPVVEKPDTLAEIEKVKAMAELLGIGAGGGKTSWVDRLIETVGPAIPGVINIISSRMQSPQQPGNPGIPRIPNELEPPMGQLPAPANPENPGDEMNFLDMVITSGGNDFLNAIANGVPGYMAAEAIISLKGRPIYSRIVKDGVEGLAEAIKRNPNFAMQLSKITTEEKLGVWLHEFVNADSYLEEGEGDEVPEPGPIKKGKAN